MTKRRFGLDTWDKPPLQGFFVAFATNDEDDEVSIGLQARDGSLFAAVVLGIDEARGMYALLGESIAKATGHQLTAQ